MGKYTLHIDHDRLAEARKRTCDYYMGRPVDRIPFQFLVDTPSVKKYDFKVPNEDFSAYMEQWIGTVNAQYELFPDTDYTPYFEYSFMGEALIATMFGAEQVLAPRFFFVLHISTSWTNCPNALIL